MCIINSVTESFPRKGEHGLIHDGSELLYNSHKWTTGLGPTGDSCGNGLLF